MEENNLYLCKYEYSGQETEGHLQMEESFVCEAKNKAEALYKYHVFLFLRNKNQKLSWLTLSDYIREDYAEGGWGYSALQLDKKESRSRMDRDWFYKEYEKYNK